MGARFGLECYADAMAAAQAKCASSSGITLIGLSQCVGVTGSAAAPVLQFETRPSDGGAVVPFEVAFVGQACDPFEGYADLLEMWGLALVALVTVWCVKNFVLKLVMPT